MNATPAPVGEAACDNGRVGEEVTATGGERPPGPPAPSLDLDQLRALAVGWFHPLVERETWTAFAYLGVGMLAALVWFVAVLTFLPVSLVLLVVLVGFPLTSLSFGLIDAMARVERRRARSIGVVIEPRPLRRATSGREWLWVRLADPARWRQVVYFLVGVVLWPVAFGVVVTLYVLGLQALFSIFEVGVFTFLLQGVLAAIVLGLAPRITVWLARKCATTARVLLGADRAGQLQLRVDELAGQREEILEAVAAERRRIERNLHDGVQQQVVALGIDLGLAAQKIADDPEGAERLIADARDKARAVIGELRTIGRGLHPAVLEDRGLDAALSAVVANVRIPITVDVQPGLRLPRDTEETAYFVATEAVSNIMKHSGARVASIKIYDRDGVLHVSVHDDGRGGADLASGSGLVGMAARVGGVDGRFDLHSPAGGPTTLTVELPHG
jgi:signal transduction histidine kinase